MIPHHPKPTVLLWADVSYTDMEEIDNTKSTPELKRVLCKLLGIQMNQSMTRVLSNMYLHALLFCRRTGLNREQTSVLLSIIKAIHAANVETLLNNMDQCFTFCSELLLCHSSMRPPFSIDLFNSEQMTQILQYLVNIYFRHFSLYKYIFTTQVQLNLSLSYSEIPGAIESGSSGAT
ncbi:coiled-coil domain-containing protein 189 [Anguilla rostrata]|uniref:coiled-coil domain-containing protein 189 n=1 Tax=Anguilla anguilla TaxID=7936 RepID=UPI0015A8BA2F|nr:coiled-coil domain-containing protein 189 [Anguilla anguilla]